MVEFDDVRRLVIELLHLDDRTEKFGPDTPLLGSVPEFLSLIHIYGRARANSIPSSGATRKSARSSIF